MPDISNNVASSSTQNSSIAGVPGPPKSFACGSNGVDSNSIASRTCASAHAAASSTCRHSWAIKSR